MDNGTPAALLTPNAAAPTPVSTPGLCRYRTFKAIPPAFAGDTRLKNDAAFWVSRLGWPMERTSVRDWGSPTPTVGMPDAICGA